MTADEVIAMAQRAGYPHVGLNWNDQEQAFLMRFAALVAEAEREPLTDEEIREWWASGNGLEDCDMCKLADFSAVVRAVEEMHRIKGGLHP